MDSHPTIHPLIRFCKTLSVFNLCFCSRSASTTPSGSPRSSQQSVYPAGEVSTQSAAPKADAGAQLSWNPFGDDNFSKLTAEELLNKDFAKLDGKISVVSVGKMDGREMVHLDQVVHVFYSKTTREILNREPDFRFTTCSCKQQRLSPVHRYVKVPVPLSYSFLFMIPGKVSCPCLVLS